MIILCQNGCMAQAKKYIVSLSDAQREQLESITHNYRYSQRERDRAQMLLLSEQGQSDAKIADKVGCHWMTVRNTRLRFCTHQQEPEADGKPLVKCVVKRAHQVHRPKRAFDGEKEAQLVALVCSTPPDGASRWTLELVKDRLIQIQVVENVGKETIRRTLKKTNLSLGTRSAGVSRPKKTPAS